MYLESFDLAGFSQSKIKRVFIHFTEYLLILIW